MRPLLDPWEDAAYIAARLASPTNRLIVVIGAEAWCEKCRELKPHFEAIAAKSPGHDLMLWLDLEDHQEFIGDYIPQDLPELLVYRQEKLLLRHSVEEISLQGLELALQTRQPSLAPLADAPHIAKRLVEPNWAKDAGKL